MGLCRMCATLRWQSTQYGLTFMLATSVLVAVWQAMQLALTTMNNEITMTIAIRGNNDDKILVEKFFGILMNNVKRFIAENAKYLKV